MLLIVILLTSYLVSSGSCSNCKVETVSYLNNRLDAICDNVSPDGVLDIDPDKKASIGFLRVYKQGSTIRSLPPNWLSSLRNLTVIDLERLGIERISPGTFSGLKKLEVLAISGNKIAEIPPGAFDGIENLKDLSLMGNLLTKIDRHCFRNLRSLENLYLSYNKISYVDDDAFTGLSQDNSVGQGQNVSVKRILKRILLNDNFLEYFNVNLSNYIIRFLDLHTNRLKEFDFANLNVFKCVKLSNNTISEIKNLDTLPGISDHYPPGYDPKIDSPPQVTIILSNNKIKHIDQTTKPLMGYVTILDLSNNELESASCLGITDLWLLSLSENKISSVKKGDYSFCKELRHLNLSHNAISNLEDDAFSGADSLEFVDLSNNKLKEVNVNIFSGFRKLYALWLHENEIISLDTNKLVEDHSKLQSLLIYGNQFDDESKIAENLWRQNIRVTQRFEVLFSTYMNFHCFF